MGEFAEFDAILKERLPLSEIVGLGVGGPADWFAEPTSIEELGKLVQAANTAGVSWRVIGSGTNILPEDDGFRGLIIRLSNPVFQNIDETNNRLRVGAGAILADVIAHSCAKSLSGLEPLAGIPGTVGGAVRCNSGTRSGDIGQFVAAVEVLDANGPVVLSRKQLRFGYRTSNLDNSIILAVTFELTPDNTEDIVKRLKKTWIIKKAQQPFGFQRSGYAFASARGFSAEELIEKAGARNIKVGGAELCARDPCFIVVNSSATGRDIRRLIEMVLAQVHERTGTTLQVQLDVW